ncbi:MAG: hypothetical protein OEZ13_01895 [Spirochaetia bacterium]|nr:hypothetical protein [Spirochaetia bacterium]
MYPLSEILTSSNASYLQYISKKTGFLISGKKPEKIQWLWVHLLKLYHEKSIKKILNFNERYAFEELLNNFGYIPNSECGAVHEAIENKIPWIFKYPHGGIFIPLELIKTLMQDEEYFKHNYFFSLLKKLTLKEQKDFASFLGNSYETQANLSFEKNQLDMALVLYIWFARQFIHRKNLSFEFIEKGRIINSPFSFLRENTKSKNNSLSEEGILPEKPVFLWSYLQNAFGGRSSEIEKWIVLMREAKKGFYRSLSLAASPKNRLVEIFKMGLLMPILPHKLNTNKNIENIKAVTPREIFSFLKQRNEKMNNIHLKN